MALQRKFQLTEDWTVVLLGGLIIALTLIGFSIPVPKFAWEKLAILQEKILLPDNLLKILVQVSIAFAVAILGTFAMGKSTVNVLKVFPFLLVITLLALLITGSSVIKGVNLEAVIICLALGLIISNLFKLPEWFKQSLATELYVKIGLVLLGTSIIFSDILKAGALGLIQALIVVCSVWYFAFWICKKLKIDKELALMISSAVSICGVSAAIATSGAIKGDSKKLSYVISLVLITAIPMMIFMPYIASYFKFPEAVTGAWLGGSIDTTGAVVASGTLVGETTLKISTIVKFSQNVLLGIAAFGISIYWSYTSKQSNDQEQTKPTLKLIWERFPKFVIGFIAASLIFSFVVPVQINLQIKDGLKSFQGLWFALAFTSIGLETNFADIFNKDSKKPLIAFLTAQVFNIVITLIIAFLLFGKH